mmetsp:Transcript_50652/g.140517  ORF Transcript_50652/g.140517 Transcript_50652/m.140517 type:complete len:307 (+) Transcript_50652:375-1295(+)
MGPSLGRLRSARSRLRGLLSLTLPGPRRLGLLPQRPLGLGLLLQGRMALCLQRRLRLRFRSPLRLQLPLLGCTALGLLRGPLFSLRLPLLLARSAERLQPLQLLLPRGRRAVRRLRAGGLVGPEGSDLPVQDDAGGRALASEAPEGLLVNGALDNYVVYIDHRFLAHAVGACLALLHDAGHPVELAEDHRGGGGKVQALTAGGEGEQRAGHLRFVLEGVDQRRPALLRNLAIDTDEAHFLTAQGVLNGVQHYAVVGKEQDLRAEAIEEVTHVVLGALEFCLAHQLENVPHPLLRQALRRLQVIADV